jgi:Protein of unknown function (DUF3048) N-terminal domain/Protein of unknown function (DUF3048) C-terminal domain
VHQPDTTPPRPAASRPLPPSTARGSTGSGSHGSAGSGESGRPLPSASRGSSRPRGVTARRRHPVRRRLAVTLAVVALAGGGVAACSAAAAPKPQASPSTTTPAPSPTPTPTPTPPPPPIVWPLTGAPVGAVANHPALAVKIENSIDARPQTGLTSADLVYEEVVEGGITRFCAVFDSTLPPQIGPVRSIRPMDPSIAGPLHGILAFSGGVNTYITAASNAGLQVLSQDAGSPGFHRSSPRPAPHNVYADPSVLLSQADAAHQAPPPAQFTIALPPEQPSAAAAQPVSALHLTMSGVSHPHWDWDAGTGMWLRSENTTPSVDAAGGGRLSATNVVVLRVDVVTTSARDPAGNPVPETVLTGTGSAFVASAGHAVAATWTKGGVDDPITLTGADGQPIRLAPGNTWIELVPNGSGSVSVS